MAARQPLPIFFYDLLFQECIPNALWIDAVLWALAFTLHLKCGCLWNGLEWYGGGGRKKERKKNEGPCLIFASHQLWLSLRFHLPHSLVSLRRLMMKCRAFEKKKKRKKKASSRCLQWLFKIALITTTGIGKSHQKGWDKVVCCSTRYPAGHYRAHLTLSCISMWNSPGLFCPYFWLSSAT